VCSVYKKKKQISINENKHTLTILILREECRLRVSDNRVIRRIFGPKREKVAGGWRRLHNEELHNLYASHNIIKVIK
jgi:hypothetical protein